MYELGITGLHIGAFSLLATFVLLWSLVWKGLALWHCAQRKQGRWFIALLIVNTLGLLEIIYLFGVAKVKSEDLFR